MEYDIQIVVKQMIKEDTACCLVKNLARSTLPELARPTKLTETKILAKKPIFARKNNLA